MNKLHVIRYGIKEFGFKDAIRLWFWLKAKKYHIPLLGKYRKIFIKRVGKYLYVRPTSSDILVLANIFCMEFEDGSKEYDIDFEAKALPLSSIEYIIDAGANIGVFSVVYAKLFPNAKIIAVELEESNFNLLIKNTCGFDNIICVKAGIWSEETDLCVITRESGYWGFTAAECKETKGDSVKGLSISSICSKFELPHIDILKMDIEGSEYEVFTKNYEEWIVNVRCLIIETHDWIKNGSKEVVDFVMKSHGFDCEKNGENDVWFKRVSNE